MRPFWLLRELDETGVSGTGIVAEGMEFSDGTCVMRWRTVTSSTAIYRNMTELLTIHGHGGSTRVIWGGIQEARKA